jgi:uncharacterized membrane protein YkvA (DUF1232 family)
MNEDFNNIDPEQLASEYDTLDKVEEGEKYVDEKLWQKVERVGKKISFKKDIIALYNYFKDDSVSWYRKTIVVAALIYFISPIDTIPDLAPLFGYLDDFGVITAVLSFLGNELTQYYDE